ncbi:MAG: hypothetical protein QXI58_00890 [Candidatus Micrarchaeia archaeon]
MKVFISTVIPILSFFAGYFLAYKTVNIELNYLKSNLSQIEEKICVLENELKQQSNYLENHMSSFIKSQAEFNAWAKTTIEWIVNEINDLKKFIVNINNTINKGND